MDFFPFSTETSLFYFGADIGQLLGNKISKAKAIIRLVL